MDRETKKKTILLVEDEVLIALAEEKKIRGFGYDVVVKNGGDEAVKAATGGAGIDLVLMDIDLGRGTSGPEAAQQILERRHVPIVFLTSHAEREMVERVRGITRYGYVIKNSGDFVLQSSIEMAFELFEADEKMRESESQFRNLFELLPTVAMIHIAGTVALVNSQCVSMFRGKNVSDFIGVRIIDYFAEEELEKLAAHMRARLADPPGTLDHYVTTLKRLDGENFPAEIFACDIPFQGGTASQVLVYDITERTRAEEELVLKSLVLDQVKDFVTITDLNGTITYVNKSEVDLFGHPGHELIGQSTNIYGENSERGSTQREILEKTLQNGTWRGEIINISADGNEHIMDCRTQVIHDMNGADIALCGIATDITERKKMEEKLKFSEEKFLRSFMMSPASLCIARLKDFKIIDINETFLRKSGFTREELIDKTAPELLVWDNPANREEAVVAIMTEGKISGKEFNFRMKDGRVLIGEYSAFIISIGGEKHILVTILDITDRKRAEDDLRRSEELYRNLFETMAQGVVYHAADGTIVSANPAAERILGLSLEQMQGRTSLDPRWRAIREDGSDLPGGEHPAIAALRTGIEVRDAVMGVYHPIMNEYRWIIVNAVPEFREGETAPYQVHTTFTDITERKLAEEKIRALLSEKEILLREVHHRIKNNMVSMMSLLSLQAGAMNDPAGIKALQDARSRMQSMALLYDKLYFSDNMNEMSVRNYLPYLVDEIISVFPGSSAVKIEKRIDDFILDAKVMSTLGLIANEFITNAMKYAFPGRNDGVITVSVTKHEKKATLVIGDDGIGIPEGVDISNSTGFGLKLAGILAHQIHGVITMERDGGTKFVITFPLPS